MDTKIPGVPSGSPRYRDMMDYLDAVAAQDYTTAGVCLIHLVRDGGSDPRPLRHLIRMTHEMAPPA